jgi:hypothetical protein
MSIPFNSSGMPKGTGSLQMRGRVWWMIYTDAAGRKKQVNTGTSDLDDARRVLVKVAIEVLHARLDALSEALDEEAHQSHREARPRGARKQGPHHPRTAAAVQNRQKTRGGAR